MIVGEKHKIKPDVTYHHPETGTPTPLLCTLRKVQKILPNATVIRKYVSKF